jgi:hypothetical protein
VPDGAPIIGGAVTDADVVAPLETTPVASDDSIAPADEIVDDENLDEVVIGDDDAIPTEAMPVLAATGGPIRWARSGAFVLPALALTGRPDPTWVPVIDADSEMGEDNSAAEAWDTDWLQLDNAITNPLDKDNHGGDRARVLFAVEPPTTPPTTPPTNPPANPPIDPNACPSNPALLATDPRCGEVPTDPQPPTDKPSEPTDRPSIPTDKPSKPSNPPQKPHQPTKPPVTPKQYFTDGDDNGGHRTALTSRNGQATRSPLTPTDANSARSQNAERGIMHHTGAAVAPALGAAGLLALGLMLRRQRKQASSEQ